MISNMNSEDCVKHDLKIPSEIHGKKIVIFDIDNTLLDVSERYVTCVREAGLELDKSLYKEPYWKRQKFWRIFLSDKYLHLDKPDEETINLVRRLYDKGYGIILLTGRPEDMRRYTVEQMKRFGIPYNLLIMRPPGNRDPDMRYKPCVIQRLIDEGLEIVEYHEDDPATIETIRRMYPWIKVVPHSLYRNKLIFYRDKEEG